MAELGGPALGGRAFARAKDGSSINTQSEKSGLRILSLDGGGIRCLSQLYILAELMSQINPSDPPKPCEVFDLICGSSFGGLIALLLGRLRLSIPACISALVKFQIEVFTKRSILPIDLLGNLKPRYKSKLLDHAIEKMLLEHKGIGKFELLSETQTPGTATTVVVATRAMSLSIALISSDPELNRNVDDTTTIWEVARVAMSFPTYFEPIKIGSLQRDEYMNGSVGANNPVNYALSSAMAKWPGRLVSCLVSIGSGLRRPVVLPSSTGLKYLGLIASMVSDTENTAQAFVGTHQDMVASGTYFRFNLHRDIETLNTDEIDVSQIYAATQAYLNTIDPRSVAECALNLSESIKPSLTKQPTNVHVDASEEKHKDVDQDNEQVHEIPEQRISEALRHTPTNHSDSPKSTHEELETKIDIIPDPLPRESRSKRPEKPGRVEKGPIDGKCYDVFASHVVDAIADKIIHDDELQSLITSAVGKIGKKRVERNLAILLEGLARRLSRNKGGKAQELAAFISLESSAIAKVILSRIPNRAKQPEIGPPSYEDVMSANKEMDDLAPTAPSQDIKFKALDTRHVKELTDNLAAVGWELKQPAGIEALREDLRKFTYPSVRSYIRETLASRFPDLSGRGLYPIHTVIVDVAWQVERFLEDDCSGVDSIDRVLTITGSYHSCQALPCLAYMKQTWPRTGAKTFAAVKRALEYGGTAYSQLSKTHSIRLHLPDKTKEAILEDLDDRKSLPTISDPRVTTFELRIDGTPHEIYGTLEQFAWLSATLRFSGDRLAYSQIRISPMEEVDHPGHPRETHKTAAARQSDGIYISMGLAPFHYDDKIDGLGTCWVPLFNRSVVAWGFPIQPRGDALGIELTFDLMLRACGTRYPTEYENALVVSCGSATIYPCRPVDGVPNGFEWHVVHGGPEELFKETSIAPVYPMIDHVDSIATALAGRMFVGWVGQAKVTLATDVPAEQGSAVRLEDHRGRAIAENMGAGLNIRPPWIGMGLNLNVGIEIPRPQLQMFEARNADVGIAVERSKNETMVYYDVGQEIGWLVPELSFVLHLAFSGLLRHGDNRIKSLDRIAFARAQADGGQAALDAFTASSPIVLGKRPSGGGGGKTEDYTFGEMIKDTLDFLDSRKRAVALRLRQNALRADLGLRGWDLLDLRDGPATFCLRYLKPPFPAGRPDWWDLAQEPNLLFVLANNVGQLITPNRATWQTCSSWSSVPRNCGLLASTVRSTHDRAEPLVALRPKILLSRGLAWHQPTTSNPFAACQFNRCNPIQKLRRVDPDGRVWAQMLRTGVHGLRNPVGTNTVLDGAVLFGHPDRAGGHVNDMIRTANHNNNNNNNNNHDRCMPMPVDIGAENDRINYLRRRTLSRRITDQLALYYYYGVPLFVCVALVLYSWVVGLLSHSPRLSGPLMVADHGGMGK